MGEMREEEVDEVEESVEEGVVTGGAVDVEWTVNVDVEEVDGGVVEGVEEGVVDVEDGVVVVLVLDGVVVVEVDDGGVEVDEVGLLVGGEDVGLLLDDGVVVDDPGSVDELVGGVVGELVGDVGGPSLEVFDDMMRAGRTGLSRYLSLSAAMLAGGSRTAIKCVRRGAMRIGSKSITTCIGEEQYTESVSERCYSIPLSIPQMLGTESPEQSRSVWSRLNLAVTAEKEEERAGRDVSHGSRAQ